MTKYDFYRQGKNYKKYGLIFIKFIVYGLVLIMRVHEKKL